MGKKANLFLVDDEVFNNAGQAIEPQKTNSTKTQTVHRHAATRAEKGISQDKNLHKKQEKYSRVKDVRFDKDVVIDQKYLDSGSGSVLILESLIKEAKEFCLNNTTQIKDITNIALYQFLINNGQILLKEEKGSGADNKSTKK